MSLLEYDYLQKITTFPSPWKHFSYCPLVKERHSCRGAAASLTSTANKSWVFQPGLWIWIWIGSRFNDLMDRGQEILLKTKVFSKFFQFYTV
jgi:hypothetical protein